MGNHRKRTIYIDSNLDKDFAKTAIDEEATYSTLATQAFKAYLLTLKKKGGKS